MMKLIPIWGFLCIICGTFAWNLATVDDSGLNFVTNNNDYVVLHVSVFYVRSFLVIQNRWNSTSKNPITLIESTWPENLLPIQPRVFPNDLSHAKTICACNEIIQSIHTAIDRNGMLWLLDNGSIYCPPKIIIYNLLKLNAEVSVDVNRECDELHVISKCPFDLMDLLFFFSSNRFIVTFSMNSKVALLNRFIFNINSIQMTFMPDPNG